MSIVITLGGQQYQVEPLTLRQSRDLRVGDEKSTPQGAPSWGDNYDLCVKTIATAVREKNPEVTEEVLWALPATEDEMIAARLAILVHAGFRSPEPTIAQLRTDVVVKTTELETLKSTLAAREAKAKITGEE